MPLPRVDATLANATCQRRRLCTSAPGGTVSSPLQSLQSLTAVYTVPDEQLHRMSRATRGRRACVRVDGLLEVHCSSIARSCKVVQKSLLWHVAARPSRRSPACPQRSPPLSKVVERSPSMTGTVLEACESSPTRSSSRRGRFAGISARSLFSEASAWHWLASFG